MANPLEPDERVFQLDQLTTEARNPASHQIDRLTALEIVYLMNDEDRRVPAAVLAEAGAIARAIDAVARAFRNGGRLIYAGAGTSGRLGVLDAAECPPTFGTPPEQVVGVIAGGYEALVRAVEGAEDRPELAVADLEPLELGPRDVLCGIATSGRTPYVLAALRYARRRGCTTIALACNRDAVVLEECDIPIVPVVGPEVLSGSTRLKAGTATKLVLNMITTGAMVQIGKTYGNLMVDLKATNTKLRLRACRIVSELLQIPRSEAERLLQTSDWEVKTALVVGKRGCVAQMARQLLEAAGGHVRVALGEEEPTGPLTIANGERVVVGVDAGGTRCRAVVAALAPDGTARELARAVQPGANANVYGFDIAAKHVTRAVLEALRAARWRKRVASLAVCIAGAGTEAARRRWRQWFERLELADSISVHADIDAVYAAADTDHGLCLLAGTGVLVQLRTPEGHCARAGGWGWLLGDRGSGYWLGRAALQRLADHLDRRQDLDQLDRALLQSIARPGEPADALRAFLYEPTTEEVVRQTAALARDVAALAAAGDAAARELLLATADQLVSLAETVVASLPQAPSAPVPLVLAGGLLASSALLRELVVQRLRAVVEPRPVAVVEDTARGALALAIRALRSEVPGPGGSG